MAIVSQKQLIGGGGGEGRSDGQSAGRTLIAKSLGIDGGSGSLGSHGGGQEGNIDPVIGRKVGVGWEGTGWPVSVDTVAAGRGGGRGGQRTIDQGIGEEGMVGGIKAALE